MTEKYPLSIRILHWLMAAIILGLLAVGLIMTSLPRGHPLHNTLYLLHKSFGITLLALAVLRLSLRLRLAKPSLPESIPLIERKLADLAHWALYGFMFLLPVSGYIMSASSGLPVKWFGIALPRLMGVDRDRGHLANSIHTYAAYALMGLLALHVGAVILHYGRHRVNLLRRMV